MLRCVAALLLLPLRKMLPRRPLWCHALLLLLASAVLSSDTRKKQRKVLDPKSVFAAIDADRDGKASSAELVEYMKQKTRNKFVDRHNAVMHGQRQRIMNLVKQLDSDNDGHVSHDEFPDHAHYKDKATFDAADEDGDGRLAPGEIVGHQKVVHAPDVMIERASKKLLDHADESNDKHLDEAELRKHIQAFRSHTLHDDL